MSLLLIASRKWKAFSLLLASFKFLMVSSCCGLSAIAYVPGETNSVVGVSAVPFEDAVAGGPAVIGFSAVEGVLAVASVPADPGDHILACGLHTGL